MLHLNNLDTNLNKVDIVLGNIGPSQNLRYPLHLTKNVFHAPRKWGVTNSASLGLKE